MKLVQTMKKKLVISKGNAISNRNSSIPVPQIPQFMSSQTIQTVDVQNAQYGILIPTTKGTVFQPPTKFQDFIYHGGHASGTNSISKQDSLIQSEKKEDNLSK